MESKVMYTEAFPSGPMRHYFFDYKQGPMGHTFVQLTCSEKLRDGGHHRNKIIFFERDLPMVVQALASLCHHAQHVKFLDAGSAAENVRSRGIPSWDPDLKPRERMEKSGAGALLEKELLSILILAGIPDMTAVDLSAKILDHFGGLSGLTIASFKELQKFKGIGKARSSSIIAAIEIARRLNGKSVYPAAVLPV